MPTFFDIDAHGRLAPASDDTRRALADRAGRFTLLPAAPDLLLALRVPATGAPASGPHCILAGDISAFPIVDFLGFIHTAKLGGRLTVSSCGVERTVVFKDGEVRGAQSDCQGERVGDVAIRLGFVRREQLAQAAAAATGSGSPLGKVMVDMGMLAAADLWKCLHEQVATVFHAILHARSGTFALVEKGEVELPDIPLAVNTQQLLMDGIRRLDELGLFRSRIPGPTAYLHRCQPRRTVGLQPLEAQVLELVDGRRQLSDIARETHLSEFEATKILFHLAEAGYVEVTTEPEAVPSADPAARLGEIAAVMNDLYRSVAARMAAAGALESLLAAVRGFLGDAANHYAPLWKGLTPAPDGALDAERLLANAGAARGQPAEVGRFLFDGARELLFFYLFQAGERLGREADEELSAGVKRRLEAIRGLR